MDDVKRVVRENYGKIASGERKGCGCEADIPRVEAGTIGYSAADVQAAPDGADLGLGCGNPTAIAGLQPGETVLDLGSGGGFDCFLAAQAVGPSGHVIGVDMTPEMIEKARANAERGGYENVEFRLGEIESLPVDDASVDVILSNCVINLVPDKDKAFAEAYRVLRPGGRLYVSDIVLTRELPAGLVESVGAYVSCVAGAIPRDGYMKAMAAAGFADVVVEKEREATELLEGACCAPEPDDDAGGCCCVGDLDIESLKGLAQSITVRAEKPA